MDNNFDDNDDEFFNEKKDANTIGEITKVFDFMVRQIVIRKDLYSDKVGKLFDISFKERLEEMKYQPTISFEKMVQTFQGLLIDAQAVGTKKYTKQFAKEFNTWIDEISQKCFVEHYGDQSINWDPRSCLS